MSRGQFIRTVSFSAVVALVALQTLIAPAAAGDTRNVFIGSGVADRVLSLSPVSTGNLSVVPITVRNDGKQTLTSAALTMGTAPASLFPSGVSVSQVFGADAGTCTITAGTLTCAFGNLPSRAVRSVAVVLTMANAGSTTVEAAVKVAEQVNDQGANRDTFVATGSVVVSQSGCDNVATFLPPGQAKAIGTGDASCDGQSTELAIPARSNGNVVQVGEVASNRCVPNRTCFGEESIAYVNGGSAIAPYLEWTIVWDFVPNSYNPRTGVIHFLDNGTPDDTSDDKAVVIPWTKQTTCSATKLFDCIVSFEKVGDGGIMIVRTETNGAMRG